MTRDDSFNFADAMYRLGTAYQKEISDHQLEVYFDLCKHICIEAFIFAVREASQRERFFPPPAVLLDYAKAHRLPQPPRPQLGDTVPPEMPPERLAEILTALRALFAS